MEPVGAIFEGEWGSLGGMYNNEEAEFMAQMLGNFSSFPSNEIDGGIPSAFWATGRDSVNCSSDVSNDNISCFLQGSDGGCSSLFSDLSGGNYNYNYLSDSQQVSMPMDFCIDDDNVKKHSSSTLQVFAEGPMGGNEICSHAIPPSTPDDKQNKKMPENPKKRMRDSGDVRKNKRNVKKRNMVKSTDEEDNINGSGTVNRQQSSSSCCSEEEEESIASQEMNGGSAALNSNGKARAGRGSATDPQSLYARKRRERINERLRILQKLVPNGTKVDISTMLEEAVQYVKFLQLQIKLLSSDDLWMYAPIAYNGIDIGLDLKIAMPRK